MTPKIWLALVAILIATSAAAWIFYKGGEAERLDQLKSAVVVKEKQDEVRNRRPDVPDISVSLHEGRL